MMAIAPDGLTLLCLLACFLLAVSAALRARNLGAQLAGALVLGAGCGLSGPLLTMWIAHHHLATELATAGIVGALAGILLARLKVPGRRPLFFWVDSISVGLACCLGAFWGFIEHGLAVGMVVAMTAGLLPGALRDLCLGDPAMFLDQPWYAGSALIGAAVCLLVIVGIIASTKIADGWPIPELSCILGTLCVVALRWRQLLV